MSLSEDDIRQEAWKQFIDNRGAHEIFKRRAASLNRWMRTRDFLGVSIPVIVAFVATTDWMDKLGRFKTIALALLAVAGLAQALLSLWSLIARWDEDRAKSIQLMADTSELEVNWRDIGRRDVAGLEAAYEVARARQRVVDARLASAELTQDELRIGMRAGLRELQKPCVTCNEIPATIDPPKKPKKPCPVCGGERLNG
ncbi:hypothetical protein BJA01nite_01900 [Bradyrhizobium japonicum]|nr:hypothetical protein CF64_12105 [Bradyrhizobium japonicum]BAL10571.1 hypothetical protein BJ6T_53110 [Bradyrhizobium japonicum USDA 6]GEC42548.1 hypothetical protein BJA01nite_01900 [Bradyrhizobium japonicum]